MTRRANLGRDKASTYSRVTKRAGTAAAAVVALTYALGSGCTSLPDEDGDDKVKTGIKEPPPRRDGSVDVGPVVAPKPDPCRSVPAQKQKAEPSVSRVLFNNDFEKPNKTPQPSKCAPYLDQTDINELYGTNALQFAQDKSIETVLLRDPQSVYTDPSGKGGRYAIGMLSDVEEDKLALSFANDMPIVNVRLDLSPIAIRNCGPQFPIRKPRLKVELHDGVINDSAIKQPLGEPLDSAIVEGKEVEDAWVFDWRTAVIPLDASKATSDSVSIFFDLLEGCYVALDNLSIVASTKKGVVDADNNGEPDDVQCSGGGTDDAVTDTPGDTAPIDEEPTAEVDAGKSTGTAGGRDAGTSTSRRRDGGR